MGTFVKIFRDFGHGADERLTTRINEWLEVNEVAEPLSIDVKPQNAFGDLYIVATVVYKRDHPVY